MKDRRLLEIVRDADSGYASIIPRGAEAMLLVEMQGNDPVSVRQRLNQLVQRLQRRGRGLISFRLTTDRSERDWLWRLARRVIPRLYRLKGSTRALPFIEDIAIRRSACPSSDRSPEHSQELPRHRHAFAHAAHGSFGPAALFGSVESGGQRTDVASGRSIYAKVLDFGGCISGEHALGLSRAAFAERQLGPRLGLFRELKRLFDPNSLFNPGKFLSPEPQAHYGEPKNGSYFAAEDSKEFIGCRRTRWLTGWRSC